MASSVDEDYPWVVCHSLDLGLSGGEYVGRVYEEYRSIEDGCFTKPMLEILTARGVV